MEPLTGDKIKELLNSMRNILINFADKNYRNSQVRNSTSALMYGFDSAHQYSPKDIDSSFYSKNKSILDQKRGSNLKDVIPELDACRNYINTQYEPKNVTRPF